MQKSTLLISSLCALAILGVGVSSCKDDDDPVVPPNLSISTEAVTVLEGGGTAEVVVVLDKAASTDINIEYDLGGTAVSPTDYSITGEGEITIPQGQTSASIQIAIVNDAIFEEDETIEISIEDVDSPDVVITNDDEAVVTIDDDDTQITASFATTSMNVVEDDGLIEIEVQLSSSVGEDIIVEYELSGTAIDSLTGWEEETGSDYYIDGVSGEVQVAAGETVGKIRLNLYTDFLIEGAGSTATLEPETIVITLAGANGGVSIGDNDELQISVQQQDGRAVFLSWDETYTTVDMDLFLWIGEDIPGLEIFTFSAAESFEGPELVFIPDNLPQLALETSDAAFGLSYTYWGGDVEPMEFTATFIDIVDGTIESEANIDSYSASYTLANINEWTDETNGTIPVIAQTFKKVSGQYVEVSEPILVEASGSRLPTYTFPKGLKKTKPVSTDHLKKFLNR